MTSKSFFAIYLFIFVLILSTYTYAALPSVNPAARAALDEFAHRIEKNHNLAKQNPHHKASEKTLADILIGLKETTKKLKKQGIPLYTSTPYDHTAVSQLPTNPLLHHQQLAAAATAQQNKKKHSVTNHGLKSSPSQSISTVSKGFAAQSIIEEETSVGTGVSPYETTAYCMNIFVDDYVPYPQTVDIDLTTGSLTFNDVDCARHIEKQELVRLIPTISALISDDTLRYQIIVLACSLFYRPMATPNMLVCSQSCTNIRTTLDAMNTTSATPAQIRDRTVVEALLWDNLLISGQCEYARGIYDNSNDASSCILSTDYSIFKSQTEANLGRPQCVPYPDGGVCEGMLSNYYYDPTQKQLLSLVDTFSPLLRSLYAFATVDNGCLQYLAQYACSVFQNQCYEHPVLLEGLSGNVETVSYAIPQLAHHSICTNYLTSCASTLNQLEKMANTEATSLIGLIKPQNCSAKSSYGASYQCDGLSYTSSLDLFPNAPYYSLDLTISTAVLPANNFTYTTQADQSLVLPFTPTVTCPSPLVMPSSDDNDAVMVAKGSCALPCPPINFSRYELQTSSTIGAVIITLSFLLVLFLYVTTLCFHEVRKNNYNLPFLTSLFMLTIAMFITAWALYQPHTPIQNHFCRNNSDMARQKDLPGCSISAFFTQFGLLSISAWWSITGFDLFLRLVLDYPVVPRSPTEMVINLLYAAYGWSIPLILTTIAAGTKSLGPSDFGMFYCFVHGREYEVMPWATAYIPLLVYLFIGCVTLSATLYSIIKHGSDQQTGSYAEFNNTGQKKTRFRNFVIPIVLEIIFFVYLLWIILFRALLYFLKDDWNNNISNFLECITIDKPVVNVLAVIYPNYPTYVCGAHPKTIHMGVWYFHQAFVASMGIAFFFALGLRPIIYKLWAAVFGYYLDSDALMLWAAGTDMAMRYGKKIAHQRRQKMRNAAAANGGDAVPITPHGSDADIVRQLKERDRQQKEKEKMEAEEAQRRQKAQQIMTLNLIAPHMRPLHALQTRPRRQLPSLTNGSSDTLPAPCRTGPDVLSMFDVQGDELRGQRYDQQSSDWAI